MGKTQAKYTTIPYSELALHLGIAGKKGKIKKMSKKWVVIALDGKLYEGSVFELVDIEDR
ncbi:MAG: hypothetical protein QXN56_02190 [Candidatus Hadarchaeum sp.]